MAFEPPYELTINQAMGSTVFENVAQILKWNQYLAPMRREGECGSTNLNTDGHDLALKSEAWRSLASPAWLKSVMPPEASCSLGVMSRAEFSFCPLFVSHHFFLSFHSYFTASHFKPFINPFLDNI
jgi:hypothetical protein